jgi:hypothetical protein
MSGLTIHLASRNTLEPGSQPFEENAAIQATNYEDGREYQNLWPNIG